MVQYINNQKNMKKITFILTGIIIIFVAVAIFFGGVFVYQNLAIKPRPIIQIQTPNKNQNKKVINPDLIECNTNNDCPNGYSCLTKGPIIEGQPLQKVCVPPGQAITL